MTNSPKLTLIIAVYKNIDFLEVVLLSIERQTFRDFEVIVAEDNDASEMKDFIASQQKKVSFPLFHVSQKKDGFRKTRILNEAVKKSRGEFLQFIDGDSVLHKDYLKEFYEQREANKILFGRRIELDEKTTARLLKTKDLSMLNWLKLISTKSLHLRHGIRAPWIVYFKSRGKMGVLGCSMGLLKEDLLKVNGFDEDYVRVGVGEDNDLEWRLLKAGIEEKSMKYRAIQYHLFHHRYARDEDYAINRAMWKLKESEGHYYCKNGIVKIQ